jgi:hypothetical protein
MMNNFKKFKNKISWFDFYKFLMDVSRIQLKDQLGCFGERKGRERTCRSIKKLGRRDRDIAEVSLDSTFVDKYTWKRESILELFR